MENTKYENVKLRTGKDHYYVDNEQLYNLIVEYKERMRKFEAGELKKKPEPDRKIIDDWYLIIKRVLTKPNWRSYTYKDEMAGDAIVDCVKALDLYNVKFKFAYTYFWRTITYAFMRRQMTEKKQSNVKQKIFIEKLDDIKFDEPEIESEVIDQFRKNVGFEHFFTKDYSSEYVKKKRLIKKSKNPLKMLKDEK